MTSRFEQPHSSIVRALLDGYRDGSWVPDNDSADRYYRWSHKAGIAAALRALADHQPHGRTLDSPQDCWDPDDRTRRELRNIAAELDERQ